MKKLLGIALLSGLAMGTSARGFDLAADYSIASNPNGAWTYGYRPTIAGTDLTVFDQLTTDTGAMGTMHVWKSPISTFMGVYKNDGSVDWDGGENTKVPVGESMMHPLNGDAVVSRLTIPATGNYTVSMAVSRFGGPTDGVSHFTLVENGTAIYDETVATPYAYQPTHAVTLSLLSGDTLDFVVDTGDGQDFHDSTGIRASVVAAVPEPASVGLIAGAMTMIAGRRRRR